MYSHYSFSKIYEAEQAGTPLNPEEMGMESTESTTSTEPKLEDFEDIKNNGYQIELMLTQADMDNLIKDGKYSTNEAKWKKTDNKTDIIDIKSLIINVGDHQIAHDNDAIVFKIDIDTANRIVDAIKDGGTATESIAAISPKIINGITVAFIKANELSTGSTQTVKPASDEQIKDGAVIPPAVSGDINNAPNESVMPKKIMSFSQFLNEGKKGDWIADIIEDKDKNGIKTKPANKKKAGVKTNSKTAKKDTLSKVKPLVEQNEVGQGESSFAGDEKRSTGYFRDNLKIDTTKTVHFGKDKMKTGSDEVDTNTAEYTDLVTKLKAALIDPTITTKTPLTVVGGASSVGSSSGYDNEALAKRRADKFIAKLKMDVPGIDKKYTISSLSKVGNATKLNSPEALAQQFVNVSFTEPATAIKMVATEVDNMVGYKAGIKSIKKTEINFDPVKIKRICVQIPEEYLNQYLEVINKFKKDNPSAGLKYGVYDIKK